MSPAKRIREIRLSKNLSQAELAEKIGIAVQNYWKIEKGITDLTLSRLNKIADALEVPLAELLGIETTSITEAQAVDAGSLLRFQKKRTALKAAVKIYLDTNRADRRHHDILSHSRQFEAYLDED